MDVQITIAINSRLLSNVVNGEICVSTKRRVSVSINNYRGIFFTIATKSELEAFISFPLSKCNFIRVRRGKFRNFNFTILNIRATLNHSVSPKTITKPMIFGRSLEAGNNIAV